MEDGLAGRLANIDADVVAVGAKLLIYNGFHLLYCLIYLGRFLVCQVKVTGDMAPGDDERVAGVDGESIEEGDAKRAFVNQFASLGDVAERAVLHGGGGLIVPTLEAHVEGNLV